ncbi:hypothetical protein Csa_012315 [Cucumis sativus]|nr:hypothetical protein Csa_012315 [Cucumis sativus]
MVRMIVAWIFGHCIGVEEFLLLLYWSKGSGRALFLNFAGDPTGFSRAPILLFVSLNALTSVQDHSGDLIAKGRGINRFYDSNFSTGCDGFQKNGWKSACVCCKSCMKYKAASDILQLNLTLMGKADP